MDIQTVPVATIVPQAQELESIKTGLHVVFFLPDVALFMPMRLHQSFMVSDIQPGNPG